MVWEHRSKTHKVLDSGVQFCLTAMMQCRELASLALSISGTTSSSLFTQEGSVFSTATAGSGKGRTQDYPAGKALPPGPAPATPLSFSL